MATGQTLATFFPTDDEPTATNYATLTASRVGADLVKTLNNSEGVAWRALVLLLLDELNTLRAWTVSFKGEVAGATSLADLKTRVATLSTLSDRTIAQVKTAFTNKINNG